ncbi:MULTISPECIES: ABC transporter ATP-binding protein [unclassified Candidatus Frackibacter]|uniref:ABC transporter ATP-binding protein n=1 Tax=unclassified Candidatus Frackibacter TaxID=2648818 RepID=UPI000891F6D0|nr:MULTISPECIES: ABC transporter ATP-binding protein [unclassified Candidatus Frackibacter]SDC62213.1 ABC-2 type transport system ATP-binding protein [Candidatus Frackibacter sp. WG11]SEM75983.1 ABC-2 type transport system ATP-binding protein [Candidatus Frackibacter sp. WG12]SFL86416.1 ABC-2 type transport system ATP-binding protein [Candidatus Frackibacter sp. WG13]
MTTAIKIKDINKSYGNLQALSNVNLEIKKGEFFGLLGPNGAGKSTLIKIMAGLAHKDSGSITVLGNDVVKEPKLTKKALGIVPQEVVIDPYFNPKEALRLQSGYFGINNNEEKIDELLTALDLQDKAEAYSRNLSGGMKRRLLIAKALVHDPEIIVLDEPTAGVDVELRNSLWDYIRKLNREGKTIILTTHYLEEAETLCDRIAIMDKGEIITIDTKENLVNSIDKKIVELNLTQDIDELPTFFNKYPYEFNKERKEINIELTKDNLIKFINEVYQSELVIEDIDIASAKLEDVFLRLTNLGGDKDE